MTTPCPACTSGNTSVFVAEPVDREYYNARQLPTQIRACTDCHSLFQDPWPDAAETADFYSADYQNYTSSSVPLLSQVNEAYQRLGARSFLREFGRDASVLDFGCGQGAFVRTLTAAGCAEVAGFDFVLYEELETVEGVRFFDRLEDIQTCGMRFDVIRMRHVIEHLTDMGKTMALLAQLLKPGGRIIGQTPNPAHYTRRLWGSYWGPLHYPYHTLLFSPTGLASSASRWGLRLLTTSGSILPSGWAISLENRYKAATGSATRGRTALYTLLMAATLPLACVDLLISPSATANYNFTLVRTKH